MRMTADELLCIVDGYARKFPDGDTPLRILARLTEELGEVVWLPSFPRCRQR
ncbi:hypothetical protein [Paramicrobacterium chengjingii]|uniref:Uncharacterized protein n=1 Tax=Paramicrobacterium chengjingii TaxID=2769067 RepID=A0ABX6YJB1_9MICO|nr:hypothetical protein [Microbacterium chengjingii]QPZ38878.1 hypothetical protein HCR76_01875 [Microbacterium chengjingii]